MKHVAILLALALTACATDPTLDETEQASTEATSDATFEGGTCTSDPEEALSMIEIAFGAGSPEHVAGVNCWREYDRDMDRCDAEFNRCIARGGRNCGWQHFDCWSMASRSYWSCIFYRSRWWCPWDWGTAGDATQDW